MSNSLLTIDMITREAVELFKNSNAFLMNIDRTYDDQFAQTGAKIGQTLRIRLPNDYTTRTGPTLSTQDTQEVYTNLTLGTQVGVDLSFSTVERTMSLQDYSERILAPAINNLCGTIAADVMSGAIGNVCNMVTTNVSGSTTTNPAAKDWLQAQAAITSNSGPMNRRFIVDSPYTNANTVSSLSGLFNPSQRISQQYESGRVMNALGFDWMEDQTVIAHTAGSLATGTTVNGANQTGTSITVTMGSGDNLKKGDIITLAGVNAVNRVTKADTGKLRQFVVTADVAAGSTSIPIYPALTPPSGGNPVQYQTVTASPASGAAVTLVNNADEDTWYNIALAPEAVTIGFADLELPRGVHEASRVADDDVSIRIITDYIPTSDQMVTRLDVLYGYTWVRPEWACVVRDSLT